MKRLLFLILPISICLTLAVNAQEHTYEYDPRAYDISGAYREMQRAILENGELSSAAEFLAELDISSPDGVLDEFGERLTLEYWLGELVSAVKESLNSTLGAIAELFSVILATSVLSYISSSFSSDIAEGTGEISRLIVTLTAYSLVDTSAAFATAFVSRICTVMNTLTPLLEAVYISSGSLTEGKVALSSLTVAVTVIGNIGSGILLPLIRTLFALSAVSSVASELKLKSLSSAVSRLLSRCWRYTTLAFSFVFSSQSVLAGAADSLGSRTVRFLADSFIPIAGGVLSETFGTVREGMAFVRSAVGIGGVIVLLLLLLSGIVPLVMYKLVFSLSVCVSEIIGADHAAPFLSETESLLDFMLAVVLHTSLMFVFALILFARSRGTV